MASTDATIYPKKNTAYRATFTILDADGDPVTGATGLDSEVSKDAGTFADCTNEATEIATASGVYYLDFTSTEMNADTVAVQVKTTSSGAKTTVLVFYPLEDADIRVNAVMWAGTATTTGDIALKTTLAKTTHITGFNDISTANVQTELTTYGALKPTTAGRTLDITTTGEAGIDWANIGAPTTAVNLSGTNIDVDQVVASVSGAVGSVTGAVGSVTGTVTVGTNNDKTGYALTAAYDAAKTAATQTSVNTIDDFVDTEVSAIKAVTDKLDTALVVDGAVYQYTANALELGPSGGGGGGDASQATLLAVKAKTDNLPSDPADASDIAASFATVDTKLDTITSGLPLDATELNAIADALLKRDWTSVTGEASYSVLQALRMLRNEWNTAAGTLSVYKEDGSSLAWQRTLTTDPSAEPITGAT